MTFYGFPLVFFCYTFTVFVCLSLMCRTFAPPYSQEFILYVMKRH